MPAYDFVCEDCRNEFEIWGTVEEHSKGLISNCPMCGSEKIERKLNAFQIIGGQKRRPSGPSCDPKSGCCG